jgi:hypothetical protein
MIMVQRASLRDRSSLAGPLAAHEGAEHLRRVLAVAALQDLLAELAADGSRD